MQAFRGTDIETYGQTNIVEAIEWYRMDGQTDRLAANNFMGGLRV